MTFCRSSPRLKAWPEVSLNFCRTPEPLAELAVYRRSNSLPALTLFSCTPTTSTFSPSFDWNQEVTAEPTLSRSPGLTLSPVTLKMHLPCTLAGMLGSSSSSGRVFFSASVAPTMVCRVGSATKPSLSVSSSSSKKIEYMPALDFGSTAVPNSPNSFLESLWSLLLSASTNVFRKDFTFASFSRKVSRDRTHSSGSMRPLLLVSMRLKMASAALSASSCSKLRI
mmetsp:Transcript_33844/g.81129  ORF Transcript_33844/g.81129 Transcript_33844/m.81129 type:complete len:224 (+) Transcript_33844:226-897(+)